MTREWVDAAKRVVIDQRWVMRCDTQRPDGSRCATQSEPFDKQPPLEIFARTGWHVAELSGDMCPACLAKGYVPTTKPHKVMAGPR